MQDLNQFQVTPQGYKSLKSEYEELVNARRPKLIERLAYARTQGDLTENSDYQNAKEELEFLDGRISELEEVLKNAIVNQKNGNTDEVAMGTKVTVKVDHSTHIYEIVGKWEADPIKKRISHDSPLGQALVGKKVGEKVEVEAPAGKLMYEILAIE